MNTGYWSVFRPGALTLIFTELIPALGTVVLVLVDNTKLRIVSSRNVVQRLLKSWCAESVHSETHGSMLERVARLPLGDIPLITRTSNDIGIA